VFFKIAKNDKNSPFNIEKRHKKPKTPIFVSKTDIYNLAEKFAFPPQKILNLKSKI